VGRETIENRRSSRRRGGPDEEDGTDPAQCGIERLGHSEVAGDDLDVRRQHRRRLGATREDTDRHARVDEEVDDGAPDPAGASADEHWRNGL
jgi:hypothetical protein